MKRTVTLLMLVFLTSGAVFAQSNKAKLISKKWVINKKAMRPIITKLLLENPQMADLDNEMKKFTIDKAIETVGSLKMDIKTTGKIMVQNDVGKDLGTWKFNGAETKIYTKSSDGKTNEQFMIETLTSSKLTLLGEGDVRLIFTRL